jgi:hypothetical protein
MSALLTPARPGRDHMGEPDEHREHCPADHGPTLDDVISRAWEVLRADVPAACPVCGGELIPRASAGAGIVGGRCESCGASLS